MAPTETGEVTIAIFRRYMRQPYSDCAEGTVYRREINNLSITLSSFGHQKMVFFIPKPLFLMRIMVYSERSD